MKGILGAALGALLVSCSGGGGADGGDEPPIGDVSAVATIEIGRMKTNAVMAFGQPSGPPANLPAGAPVPPPVLPGTVNFMGGVPIKVGDQMIGAISVSGAPGGDKDAACANAALAKVAGKLK